MAGSVNKVILIGNLGQDPEVKSFQNGGRIANLRIATSESWKDRQTGETKGRWMNVGALMEDDDGRPFHTGVVKAVGDRERVIDACHALRQSVGPVRLSRQMDQHSRLPVPVEISFGAVAGDGVEVDAGGDGDAGLLDEALDLGRGEHALSRTRPA